MFLMKKYDFVLFNERNEEKQLLLILPHIQNLRNWILPVPLE